jgi:hypothetical protein
LRSPSDPIRSWRRRRRFTAVGGTCALALMLVWALRPLPSRTEGRGQSQPSAPRATDASPNESSLVINTNAFNSVRLWNPVPRPAVPVAAEAKTEPAPKPLRLQLIGIIHDSHSSPADSQQVGKLHAALYDPDEDVLLIVTSGEKIKQHTITNITAAMVEISDGRTTQQLRLKEAG